MDKVGIGTIEKAYHLYVVIDDIRTAEEVFGKVGAEKKIEVAVKIDGQYKEFTFREFAEKLGF